MSSKLFKCKCKHDFQDIIYGGLRVHNKTKTVVGDKPVYRCSVCHEERKERREKND